MSHYVRHDKLETLDRTWKSVRQDIGGYSTGQRDVTSTLIVTSSEREKSSKKSLLNVFVVMATKK